MHRLRRILLVVLLILVAGGVAVWLVFEADMRQARAALAGRSTVVETAAGPIEYADVGEGFPLLTIHGAGGGFDQGLDNAGSMVPAGFRVISPSRFGYLRTPIPADSSPAAQADAHAALLDSLGIDKAVVLGVSAGTRSALELALRHPERVAALILVVPATYYPDMANLTTQRTADFPLMLWLVNNGADFAWWSLEHLAPDMLISFVGVPPAAVHSASAADQASVMAIVRSIEPLSERFPGISIDSQPDLSSRPLDTIRVPTFLVSARDDLFNTFPSASYAAGKIPGAEFVAYDSGGHLLVGHGDDLRGRIAAFLARNGLATPAGDP